jgi:hypothetical protein
MWRRFKSMNSTSLRWSSIRLGTNDTIYCTWVRTRIYSRGLLTKGGRRGRDGGRGGGDSIYKIKKTSFHLFDKILLRWVKFISTSEIIPNMGKVKGAQVWDFRPIFFYTNKSYKGRWLEDWRKKKNFWKTTADIRHFVFFTQAEPALKICLRWLSLR